MLILILLTMAMLPVQHLFDFNSPAEIEAWRVVDDVVMGGRSDGDFRLENNSYAVYSGQVSLENNGGFSSVRYRFEPQAIKAYSAFQFRVKGDGKRYQFRVKNSPSDRHSYIHYFETSGEWETITISFKEMRPTFRGRALELPNFAGEQMSEMAFLIGNKQAEDFELRIDWIGVE